MELRSPALQADSLPAEPQEKPKNTGVGILSLLQQIFQTQELNWGFLHGRHDMQKLVGPCFHLLQQLRLKRFLHFSVCNPSDVD